MPLEHPHVPAGSFLTGIAEESQQLAQLLLHLGPLPTRRTTWHLDRLWLSALGRNGSRALKQVEAVRAYLLTLGRGGAVAISEPAAAARPGGR